MTQARRIMISLPQGLLDEVDLIARKDRRNRSEFIREAMMLYIRERKRSELRERMREGYLNMAQLNLQLAESAREEDDADLESYEGWLAGAGGGAN